MKSRIKRCVKQPACGFPYICYLPPDAMPDTSSAAEGHAGMPLISGRRHLDPAASAGRGR